RAAAAGAHEGGRGFDLGAHAAGAELRSGEQVVRGSQVEAPNGALVRGAVSVVHGVDVGQDQQDVGLDVAAEDRGHPVLVDDRVDSFESQRGIVIYGGTAAPARDDDVAGGDQVPDHVALDHADRLGARREPSPATR